MALGQSPSYCSGFGDVTVAACPPLQSCADSRITGAEKLLLAGHMQEYTVLSSIYAI